MRKRKARLKGVVDQALERLRDNAEFSVVPILCGSLTADEKAELIQTLHAQGAGAEQGQVERKALLAEKLTRRATENPSEPVGKAVARAAAEVVPASRDRQRLLGLRVPLSTGPELDVSL